MGERYTPKHLSGRTKGKGLGAGAAALVLGLVLLVVLISAAFARYQHQFTPEGSIKAQDFYFTSDFLDGGAHTLAPGSTEVSFTLGNYADELRYAEVDITYTVTVKLEDGAAAGDVTLTNGSGTLVKDKKSDAAVTISGLKPGKTYTVTAVGKGGYEKTLTATVEVLPEEAVVYKALDTTNSEYVLLTVWAQGYQGSVTITPPAGKNLIPDNTDPVMGTAVIDGAITDAQSFQTDGYSSHTYRFFGGGVTAEDFTVTYGSGSVMTAEVKAPN